MSRLIDADLLMEEIMNKMRVSWRCVFQNFIENAPTVEAVPVVRGAWLENKMCNHKPYRIKNPDKWMIYECSVCGYSNGRKRSNFCSNCGADMRKGNV